MSQDQDKSQLLTVKHGRLLHEQGKMISSKVDQLQPLLSLLDREPRDPASDPIEAITTLLEQIVQNQLRHDRLLNSLGQKLDVLHAELCANRR